MDLESILGAIARKDEGALARFYDTTVSSVHGVVSRILADRHIAEETTLDVYLHVWRKADSYRPHRGSPLAWLLGVARNRAKTVQAREHVNAKQKGGGALRLPRLDAQGALLGELVEAGVVGRARPPHERPGQAHRLVEWPASSPRCFSPGRAAGSRQMPAGRRAAGPPGGLLDFSRRSCRRGLTRREMPAGRRRSRGPARRLAPIAAFPDSLSSFRGIPGYHVPMMRTQPSPGLLALVTFALGGPLFAADTVSALRLFPPDVVLRGDAARQRLLVSGERDGRRVDLTREAEFRTITPETIQVSPEGIVTPVTDGIGVVEARLGSSRIRAEVRVEEAKKTLPLYFETHIQPILTRQGCNSGPCHGKQRGQNGFQLSLLGFDDDYDHSAVTRGLYSRRLSQAFPERSLFLLKPTGELPHGGGQKFAPGSDDYRTLRNWIDRGMLRRPEKAPVLEGISVTPETRRMGHGEAQQLLVMARYSDGSARDVTDLAKYMSSESPVVRAEESGLATSGSIPGQATIMVRYRTLVATSRMTVPLEGEIAKSVYAKLPRYNFIDEHVWRKLESLGFTPSDPAGDATLLRRAYLDAIGRLPTPAEVRAYLEDASKDRRARMIDRLLGRPEYADHWAGKWVDLLRPNPYRVGMKAVLSLDAWVRASFRRNQPYDEFVREAVTASGSTFRSGATTILRDRRTPDEIATMVSQLFLGVRLECAKCHHHPFEALSQADFYSFAAYFAKVGRKGTGLSPPISGGEEFFFTRATGSVTHPRTGETLSPRPLFAETRAERPSSEDEPSEKEPSATATDPRSELADWLTRDNPYFARVIVNRVWADLMGRGLVEPVDDLRVTNPPSNAALLEALADHFREIDYDLKGLLRAIMSSYVYSLGSTPTERNVMDTRQYSRHYRQRLRAEVLLDAVCDITGVPEPFDAVPAGSRSSAIWTHRSPSLFLDTFGRPDPNQDPPCERTSDTSVVQALHLMNSPDLNEKVTSDNGLAARLAASEMSEEAIVDELYLLVYSRLPRPPEGQAALARFAANPGGDGRRRVTEDLLWALLNTAEFVFKD